MSSQTGLFTELFGAAEEFEELRRREADYTPRALVRALLWESQLLDELPEGSRILDLCAGAGVWSSEVRLNLHKDGVEKVHITANDISDFHLSSLRRWADEVSIGDWHKFIQRSRDAGKRWDVVVTNPPFSAIATLSPGDSIVAQALTVSDTVLVLHTQAAFCRGRAGRAVWNSTNPSRSITVSGSVSFRADGQTDARSYTATVFTSGPEREPYMFMLDDPPGGCAWKWDDTGAIPGAEPEDWCRSTGLVCAPGHTP